MQSNRLKRIKYNALNRLKWALTAISGLMTSGFVMVLES
jgi:hypothetical protein